MDPSTLEQVQMVFRDMARECKRFARGQNTAFYQAKFFASLLRISSVAPTRVATREKSGTWLPASPSRQPGARFLSERQMSVEA
jgi:hypothetical protein